MADRPRVASPEHAAAYPRRLAVIHQANPEGWPQWAVYRGLIYLGEYESHAEAITAAHKLAHDTAPRVWTTPDSGTQADYSLVTGSA